WRCRTRSPASRSCSRSCPARRRPQCDGRGWSRATATSRTNPPRPWPGPLGAQPWTPVSSAGRIVATDSPRIVWTPAGTDVDSFRRARSTHLDAGLVAPRIHQRDLRGIARPWESGSEQALYLRRESRRQFFSALVCVVDEIGIEAGTLRHLTCEIDHVEAP